MLRCDCSCLKNYQARCFCAISFGLGMSLSCFCPTGLTLFLCAVILVALGYYVMETGGKGDEGSCH